MKYYILRIKVSVSNNGHVWGVDHRDKIWYRKGANNQTILGANWKSISGNLKQVICHSTLKFINFSNIKRSCSFILYSIKSYKFIGIRWVLRCMGNQF